MSAKSINFDQEIESPLEQLLALADEQTLVSCPQELQAFEEKIARINGELSDLLVARAVQNSIDSNEVTQQARKLIDVSRKTLRSRGRRPIFLRGRFGMNLMVWVPYYSRSERSGRAVYPALQVLGIIAGRTPLALGRISRLIASVGSYEEARQILAEHDYELSIRLIRTLIGTLSQLVRQGQRNGGGRVSGSIADRNVVVSVDGGRVRIRTNKRSKTKKNRHKYRTDWREPKLLIIYVVDGEGKIDRSFPPIIDGTLQGPDHVFRLLTYYIRKLGVESANRILFVADGAKWIWNRVDGWFASLGVDADKQFSLLDFYHAAEYLTKIATSKKKWTPVERRRWVKTQRNRLLRGEVGAMLDGVNEALGPRTTKDQRTWRNYLQTHGIQARRMGYARATALCLPIGSGAMESAIRRIVNLRIKGASIYWKKENAEAMLHLRAAHKTGRAQDLYYNALEQAYSLAI